MKRGVLKVFVLLLSMFRVTPVFGRLVTFKKAYMDRSKLFVCMSEDDGSELTWNIDVNNCGPSGSCVIDDRNLYNCNKNVTQMPCRQWRNDWYTVHWNLTNSLSNPMGPVLDQRWADFYEHVLDSSAYKKTINLNQTGTLVFSVRGEKDAHLLLCDGEDYNTNFCYWVIIGGWDNTECTIRRCPNGVPHPPEYPMKKSECAEKKVSYAHKTLSQSEWRTFVLKCNYEDGTIHLFDRNKVLLKFVDSGRKPRPVDGYRVFLRSTTVILVRFHKYQFFHTKETDAELHTEITPSGTKSFCVQMLVGLCAQCELNVSWSLYGTQVGAVETIEGSTAVYELPTWKLVEMRKEVGESYFHGQVKISVVASLRKSVENPLWAVGGIRECPPAAATRYSVIRKAEGEYKQKFVSAVCQKLSYNGDETANALSPVTYNTGIETSQCPTDVLGLYCSANCDEMSYNDGRCSGVIHCEGNQCTCLPGYRGESCSEKCDHGFYGQDCSKCGSCKDDSCDFITGVCTHGCSNPSKYIMPFCETEIIPPPPNIDFLNQTSVRVSLPAEYEYKQTAASYEFYLETVRGLQSKTGGVHQIDESTSKLESTFDRLQPGLRYLIHCELRFAANTSYPSKISSGTATFSTPCTPTDEFLTEAEEGGIVLKRSQETRMPESCPDSWYSAFVVEVATGNTSLHKDALRFPCTITSLKPYTLYNVTVYSGNVTFFSKEIQTLEAPPSPVTKLRQTLTNRTVDLKWDPPKEENGMIRHYVVSLKAETYFGCEDQKMSTPTKTDEALQSVTSTAATFRDLHPYASYLVTVVAWNSYRGEESSITVETEENEIPTEKFVNLRLQDLTLMWDMPKDCTTISGPIDGTKLIIEGIGEAVREYREERQINGNTFELGSNGQEIYGAETYRAEVYVSRGLGKKHNESAYERLVFATPPKAPPAVRNFEIYEVDSSTSYISLRWQEPLPPTNGKIEKYSVKFCDGSDQSDIQIISSEKPCLLWKNYICARVSQPYRKFKWIEIRAYNFNVSAPGPRVRIANKLEETVPDAPSNLAVASVDRGVLNVSWSHPWQSGGPLREFIVEITVVSTNLRKGISNANVYYDYIIDLYKTRYSKLFYLFPSTTYNIAVRAMTHRNLMGRQVVEKWRTPSAIGFARKLTFETRMASSLILLHIPKVVNDTWGSELHVIVKGPQACDRYLPVNSNLKELAEVKDYEVAWCAATFSEADEYGGQVFTVGDNKTYGNATNCPLKAKESYTVVVIVQTKEGSTSKSIVRKTSLIRLSYAVTRHDEIWLTPVVIFLVIAATAFYVYRRTSRVALVKERIMQGEASPSHNGETRDEKDIPLTAVSKHTSSTVTLFDEESTSRSGTPEVPLTAATSDLDGKRSSLVKVKDFEHYVRQAIESGLIDRQYETFPRGQTKPCDCGKLRQNKSKNRYANLMAYDETRVVLKKLPGDPYSDYINANYIKGYNKEKFYIATQGPKSNTVVDFWRMVWQEEVLIICMLANVTERGKTKCEQYWPDIGKAKKYGDVIVLNVKHSVFADYTFRTLRVSHGDETRKIEHFHYTAWPDHSVPLYTHSVVTYLKKLLATPTGGKPIVVHCSAGVGRTGTIILCDICLRRAAAEGVVDVYAETESIRNQRSNMVDNKQQYLLAHLAIVECLLSIPTTLPCNDALPMKIKEIKKQLTIQQLRLQDTAWQDEALRPSVPHTSLSKRNLAKNRFPELASNQSRVYLKRYPTSDGDSDYISAVYVDGVRLRNQYFATQLPLPSTVGDFWRMVTEFKVELIVMLQPPDPEDPTCCDVAPKTGEFKPTPYINVTCKDLVESEYYTSQKFVLVDNSEKPSREQPVTILCSNEWKPGRNQKPPPVMSLVTMWQAAERISRGDGPTVVLCHDGVTGCGLYLALSFLLERMAVERECDVCLAIRAIRRSRPDFVRSLEHMEYLYDAALTYLEYFETYANFS